jgi:RNA polymerase sigma-70 factor (ECF subfamily)
MAEDIAFPEFVRRVRAGDARAAEELVRRYEAAIRLEVRMRLRDPRLRRVFDSMDICQSVLASFFVRTAAGQYDLNEPSQLLKLLVAMARNKVAHQARRQGTRRRDVRRVQGLDAEHLEVAGREPTASQVVAGEELLQQFRARLSNEERHLAELRAQGREWGDIAAELGGTPQAQRMKLTRAVERVAQELGLEDSAE